RPAVRSSGGKANDPSSATSTVASGAAVGAGPLAAGPDCAGFGGGALAGASAAEPRNVAVTETVWALVVVPSTAIAPLPYVVPSTGWAMVSVGACAARNGTVMTTSRGVSAPLPVWGLRAVIWKRFWPRRRSTWTLHSPL